MVQQKVLVIGASSWLGYLLLKKLHDFSPNLILAGTIHRQEINLNFVQLVKVGKLGQYEKLLFDFQPTVIVNFLRGENEDGIELHNRIIKYTKKTGGYYVFASSALALDGYTGRALTEDVLAQGKSPYGIFKAGCEQKLYDSSIKWCILRFASAQGWIDHKLTRNEIFLKKLKLGEEIKIDTGVIQNRMLAGIIVDGIVQLIEKKIEGIIHFGTIDSSEEVDFLKKQAELFGYSCNLIKEGKERNANLFTIPSKIYKLLGESYRQSEQDTLNGLLKFPALLKYKNNLNN